MKLRIITRKSKLALWQAHFVKTALEKKYPRCQIELISMTTEGDQQQTISLAQIGGKANFVKALQKALLNNEADLAVHSIKDMSVHHTPHLTLAAICERADPRDAFLSHHFETIDALPKNAIVGTASPRRACLIKSLRADVQIKLLRGNVDTRLAKLDAGEYDAIILAAAGVIRLGLSHRIRAYLPENIFTPAIGQGAIGVECRENDVKMRELLQFLHHENTARCIIAERMVNQILNGDCHTAIGAHAKIMQDKINLSAIVGDEDGSVILRANATDLINNAKKAGEKVANDLLSQGARKLIKTND